MISSSAQNWNGAARSTCSDLGKPLKRNVDGRRRDVMRKKSECMRLVKRICGFVCSCNLVS